MHFLGSPDLRSFEYIRYRICTKINTGPFLIHLGQYKWMQKNWKMTEISAHWFSSESTQQELSNEYQYDRV